MTFAYRGPYSLGIQSVRVADPFLLYRRTLRARNMLDVLVCPRVIKLSAFSPSRLTALQFTSTFSKESEEAASDTRRYVQGDPLSRIHRNLSARQGELITRLFERESDGHILCALDLSSFETENVLLCEDILIEACISVADYILRQSRPVVVVYAAGDIVVTADMKNRNDLQKLVWDMAAVRFTASVPLEMLLRHPGEVLYTVAFTARSVDKWLLDAVRGTSPTDFFIVRRSMSGSEYNYNNSGNVRVYELEPSADGFVKTLEGVL